VVHLFSAGAAPDLEKTAGRRRGRFLSHPADSVGTMEAQDMTLLFTSAGLSVELVYEGALAGCPHCDCPAAFGLTEAA